MPKRVLLVLLFLATLSGYLYWGRQSHRLTRPNNLQPSPALAEGEWADTSPTDTFIYIRPIVERYLKVLPSGSRLLDLGCGNGAMLASFAGRGWQLVGVDISKSGIEQARKRWPDIEFVLGDATGDLSALGRFDGIICTEVIEHVFLPRLLVQNCFRLLKPGGVLVISTSYHGWLKDVAIAAAGLSDEHYDPLPDDGHVKFWSVQTLSRLLWEAGFDELEFTGAGRVAYLWASMVMLARKPSGPR